MERGNRDDPAHGGVETPFRPARPGAFRASTPAGRWIVGALRSGGAEAPPSMPNPASVERRLAMMAGPAGNLPRQPAVPSVVRRLVHVGRTPGISCEAPICSGFVSFIPLFGRLIELLWWRATKGRHTLPRRHHGPAEASSKCKHHPRARTPTPERHLRRLAAGVECPLRQPTQRRAAGSSSARERHEILWRRLSPGPGTCSPFLQYDHPTAELRSAYCPQHRPRGC
jgi:hypothetical protein